MSLQRVLPAEILCQIYDSLPSKDILNCQLVCHDWHIPAKRKFYELVEFNTPISISLFISCISKSQLKTIPPPGIYVRKFRLVERPIVSARIGLTLSEHHIHALIRYCPNVEIVECSNNLQNLVLEALLNLPQDFVIPQLRKIPFLGSSYLKCAIKYSSSLDILYLKRNELYLNLNLNTNFLRSFVNLLTLDLSHTVIKNINAIFTLLEFCPKLIDLRVQINEREFEGFESQDGTEFLETSDKTTIKQPILLENLTLVSTDEIFQVKRMNQLLKKLSYLKRLRLFATDIFDATQPTAQLEDMIELVQYLNSIKDISMTIKGNDYNKNSDIALLYLESLFQPSTESWYTSLMIMNNNMRGYGVNELLKYELPNSGHERMVELLLPDIELEDRTLHTAYIDRFSPYVNNLIINYEGTQLNQHGCEYFLETVVEKCQALQSLTLICGNYGEWGCRTINPSIYHISLITSFVSATFFNRLSNVCPNLKKLEIYKCHVHMMNDTLHYYMPETSLEEMEFNLDQFRLGAFYEKNSVIIKVILKSRQKSFYYYTDYDLIYMTRLDQLEGENEMKNQASLSVVMEFQDIQKIRATYFGIPGIEIDLNPH